MGIRYAKLSQNPRSNHEIHVLFEHGFNLQKPKLGPDFACMTLHWKALRP